MKDKTKYLIISIITIVFVIIASSYAYFFIIDDLEEPLEAMAGTTDVLSFQYGNRISIDADIYNFGKQKGDITQETEVKATLIPNDATNEAQAKYNVFLVIEENSLVYTTSDKEAELVVKITQPDGTSLEHFEGINKLKDGSFDITTRMGTFLVAKDYVIEAKQKIETQTWQMEVTLVNLKTSQKGNAGHSFRGKLYITKEEMETYKAPEVNNIVLETKYNSLKATLEYHDGSKKVDKYYFGIRESGKQEDITYEESAKATYEFSDLQADTMYELYSYVENNEGIYSNIYDTQVRTNKYQIPTIDKVDFGVPKYDSITATVTATAHEDPKEISKYYYSIDGAPYEESTSNVKTFEDLEDSREYRIKIKVKDANKQDSTEYEQVVSTKTLKYPEIAVTATDASGKSYDFATWTNDSVTVTAAIKEENSDFKLYYCETTEDKANCQPTMDNPFSASKVFAKPTSDQTRKLCFSAIINEKYQSQPVCYLIKQDVTLPSCKYDNESMVWQKTARTINFGCEENSGSGCNPLYPTMKNKLYDYSTQTDSVNFEIRDNAGNSRQCTKDVNVYVDFDSPTCGNATNSSTTWTKGSKTITQICNDSHSGCIKDSYEKTYSNTQLTDTVTIADQAGNENTCTYNVYLDNTPPTCESSGGSESFTNKDVVIKGTCSDADSKCTGDITKNYTENIDITESPGSVSDNAGNSTVCPNQTVRIIKDGWYTGTSGCQIYKKDTQIVTGFQEIGSDMYYFNNDGCTYPKGWLSSTYNNCRSGWYYIGDNGKVAVGWLQPVTNGKWYYLSKGENYYTGAFYNPKGCMWQGWLKNYDYACDSGWWYFNTGGDMKNSGTIDGWSFNSGGCAYVATSSNPESLCTVSTGAGVYSSTSTSSTKYGSIVAGRILTVTSVGNGWYKFTGRIGNNSSDQKYVDPGYIQGYQLQNNICNVCAYYNSYGKVDSYYHC